MVIEYGAEMAAALGHDGDAANDAAREKSTRAAFQRTFFDKKSVLYRDGEATQAIALMTADDDRSCKHIVQSGTTITWEAWDQKYKPNQDWIHAWGAAPANLLPRFVLGAQPLTPGWKRARILAENFIPRLDADGFQIAGNPVITIERAVLVPPRPRERVGTDRIILFQSGELVGFTY